MVHPITSTVVATSSRVRASTAISISATSEASRMLSSSPVLADVSPGGIHGRCDGCGAAREVCLGSQPAHGQGYAKYRLVLNPVSRVAQTPASARRLAPCEEVADQRREAARHSLEAQPRSPSESCHGPGYASTSYRCSHAQPSEAFPKRSARSASEKGTRPRRGSPGCRPARHHAPSPRPLPRTPSGP